MADEKPKTPPADPVQEILNRIPVRRVLTILFTFAVMFLSTEAFMIVRLLNVEGLHRLTTLNGSVVIIGGLCWAAVFTLVFVWPMKIMNVEGLRLTYRMQQDMKEMGSLVTEAKETLAELKALLPDVKNAVADSSELVTLFKTRDFDKVEKVLGQVVEAMGKNGEVAAIRQELQKEIKDQAQKATPEVKVTLMHAVKTLDAVAEYLDLRVT
jgi:hypothetical protein